MAELDFVIAENEKASKPLEAVSTEPTLAAPKEAALEDATELSEAEPAIEVTSSEQSTTNNYESELLAELSQSESDENHIAALELLMGGLDIQPVRKTKLINISFESQSAKMAALIPNAVGRVYIEDYLNVKDAATEEASEWLVDRLEKLEITLRESEEKLQRYKSKNKLVDLSGGVTRYNEQELLSFVIPSS